jgi:hypothetical protein
VISITTDRDGAFVQVSDCNALWGLPGCACMLAPRFSLGGR